MDTSKMTTPNMKKKLYFVIIPAFMLAFSIILYNLVDITVIKHDDYLTRATSQQLKPKNIPAKRGTIYDRNMAVLAQSATVWDLVISPSDMEETQKEFIANTLSKIIAKTPEEQELYRQKIIDRSKRNSRYEIIAKKLEKPIADEIRKAIIEGKPNEDASKKNDYLVGIDLVESAKRYYPNSTFASSVIGFTGADSQGLYGIEYYYDKQLSGTPGYIVSAQNALGENMPVSYENKFDPIDGNNLVLTLDESAQFFLEKALNKLMVSHKPDEGCAGIIMDVNTGEILAMATMPNFDLNAPFEIDKDVSDKIKELPQEEQKDAYTLAQQKQWKNKNINFTYEPGSTFKPLVAAAALEEKTSSLESRFYCTGSIEVDGVKMRCHKDGGHGQENFTDALVNSCNPAYVKIGADLGANLYFKYFKAFGLTQKTGIDLPGEEMGFYYTADKLTPVSLASCSFGQSLTLTPIQ
ncbi:MAG: penicillin-binding transpeptidase domain-containing protein, partial [Oscillospiraceae bacterium]